ncbi:hypothetical protein SEPCBS119000_005219 [Sporothrix epigloea]|uniref:Uncharacterized protein n=1 Tax=Sporothrix epigloea TaxID=1892477 RepID=A0ABP0DWK6_9PEZI
MYIVRLCIVCISFTHGVLRLNRRSSSHQLLDRYSSCVSAGSTGILTVTATAGAGGFENGPFEEGGGPFGGPFGWESQSKWPSNDATTTFTTTGCSWATQGWFGGGGWGDGDGSGGGIWGDGGFWGRSQTGWAYRTVTKTVTTTFTSVGNLVTATGIATVEMAVSGRQTSATTLFHAKATGSAGSQSGGVSTSSGSGPARPLGSGSGGNGKADGLAAVKIMALALGTLIAAIGML